MGGSNRRPAARSRCRRRLLRLLQMLQQQRIGELRQGSGGHGRRNREIWGGQRAELFFGCEVGVGVEKES